MSSCFVVYVGLSNNLFTPDIIIPGLPTAGDNFSIICRLAGVVERLVSGTSVILSFVSSPGGVSGNQFLNGSAFIKSRMFNPGRTSDSGSYTCVSTIIVNGGIFYTASTNETLQIKSKQNRCANHSNVNFFCISFFSSAEHHCVAL